MHLQLRTNLICCSFLSVCLSSSLALIDGLGYGTKTPYSFVYPPDKKIADDELYNVVNVDSDTLKLSCGAVHASAIIRHGARNPGKSDALKISEIHERIRDVIDKSKFENLVKWTNPFPRNNDKTLNDAGEAEQHQLGRRFAQNLKSLFSEEDPSSTRFITSSAKRAEASAAAFFEGFADFLQIPDESAEEFDSEVNDELMRFHSQCKKFKDSVENNKTALAEYVNFMHGNEVANVLNKVIGKLGLDKNVLEPSDLKAMFVICGSETALSKGSPWCDVFDDEDIRVLEYAVDLKKYYKYGPAYKITSDQTCELVSELFTVMDDVITVMERTEDDPDADGFLVGNLMFGHAETLSPLYSTLGLFNDSIPLTAKNYNQHQNRHFRASDILPFSANIMIILYECETNDELVNDEEEYEEIGEDYYVQVLVNEKPIKIPGCAETLCSYNKFRERHLDQIDECHIDEVCNPEQHKTHDEL